MIVNEGLANAVTSRRKSLLTVTTAMDSGLSSYPSSPAHAASILTTISGGDLNSISPSSVHLKPAKQSKINEYLEQRRPRRVSVAVNKGRTSLSPSTTSLNLSQTTSPNDLSQSISSPIKPASNISFRKQEIDQMYENPLCMRKVREAFLYNGSDAFQNYCSIVSRGKESSSPSRRRRVEAYMEIFAALAGLSASKIYAENINLGTLSASFDDIAIGLRSLSDRWLTYSSDELYSLAFMMDINEKGSVCWTDFFDFMLGIHEALAEDYKQNPAKVFESLYDDLKEISYQASLGILPSSQNRVPDIPNSPHDDSIFVRLQCLASYARDVFGMQPLTKFLQAAGPIGGYLYADDLVQLLVSLGAQIDDSCLNYSPDDKAMKTDIPVSPIPKTANEQYKAQYATNGGVISREESHIIVSGETEETMQSFHDSIQDLRVTAKKISEKIAEQDGNMQETMGIWSAIHNIEKNFNRLATLSPTKEKPAKFAFSDEKIITSPNRSPDKTMFKLFAEQDDSNDTDNIDTNIPFSPVVQEKNSKCSSRLARTSVTINTSMNTTHECKKKSPNGTVANRRRSLDSTPKELRRSSIAASILTNPIGSPSGDNSVTRSRHIAHFRNSTKPANMSIFRSPGGRTVHPNRNSYDSSTYSWKPTVITGKYNDRFQTTHDLMDAKKMNCILYNQ